MEDILNQEHKEEDDRWAGFMDRLVHDLREPLRSINVYSELLAELAKDRLGADGEQFLGEIHAGAARMRILLEGLAGYSTALHESSVSVSRMPAEASVQSAVRIVVANLDDTIRANKAVITGPGMAGSNPAKVALGLDRLMQLLENLIGNSLRFRSDASPVIKVSTTRQDDGMWAVSVEDNGIGIAPEDCEAIFRPFVKVEGKKYPGAGLGLTICKQIVEAHGGTIRMESTPGQGSICTFTLPEA